MGRPRVPIQTIPHLTLAEVAVLLDQDTEDLDKKPPAGSVDIAQFGGMEGYRRWWRSQTPAQRLARARRKWEEES